MKRRIITIVSILSLVIFMLTGATVFCEEESEVNDIPQLTVKLNPDGTSSMLFVIGVPQEEQENIDSYIENYSQIFGQQGYNVSKSEDSLSMILSKTFTPEDGYLVDFSMYGMGTINFVEFNDLFCNRYGIRSNAFNAEEAPAGRDYFMLTIETPVKAAYSNAAIQENGGKINTWKISSGSKNEINLTFKKYNIVAIVVAIFVVIILLLFIFAIMRNSQKKKESAITDFDMLTDFDNNVDMEGEQEIFGDSEGQLNETEWIEPDEEHSNDDEEFNIDIPQPEESEEDE